MTAQVPSCFASVVAGDLQGRDDGASCSFLGIPFAAPPVGNGRWRPPQPVASWAGTLNVMTPPPNCSTTTGGDEDCLKLNLWIRDPYPTAAPVIVWFHTGAFVAASVNFAGHNGRRLAEETGAIVVAANYRLGPMGFLVHPALAAEDPLYPVSGNYGLLDQRAALAWVRDNIARFGGDPGNVTIAGTSAGGDSAGLHLVSPESGSLFHRAVVQSGTPTVRWPTAEESASQGHALATALGCIDPATVVYCMRSKTRVEVMTALPQGTQQVVEVPGRTFWGPVVDGREIPDQPRALFQAGLFRRVPTMIGITRDEGWAFTTRSFQAGASEAQYTAWVTSEFGADAASVLSMYPPASFATPTDALAQVVGDGQFTCEAQRLARSIAEAHVPAYLYSYEHEIAALAPGGRVIHGLEGNILFGNNYAPPQFASHPLDATDNALHAAMAGYWSRFAATGMPNVDDDAIVHWPPFKDPLGTGRGANRYFVLKPALTTDKRLREAQCGFWEPLFLRSMFNDVPAGGS